MNGIQEVSGSIPLISTNSNRKVGVFSLSKTFESLSDKQTTAVRSRLSPPRPTERLVFCFFLRTFESLSGIEIIMGPAQSYHVIARRGQRAIPESPIRKSSIHVVGAGEDAGSVGRAKTLLPGRSCQKNGPQRTVFLTEEECGR